MFGEGKKGFGEGRKGCGEGRKGCGEGRKGDLSEMFPFTPIGLN